jgi:hypothetical protein
MTRFCLERYASFCILHLIKQPHWVFYCLRPTTDSCLCWPMKSQVKHICSSPLGNSPYNPLGNSILVVCTITAKKEFLLLTFIVVFEHSQCKYSIVRVMLFHLDILLFCHWFQMLHTLDCFVCSCWVLAKVEFFSTGMINKESSTCVSMFSCPNVCGKRLGTKDI